MGLFDKNTKTIKRVKVLGVRTSEETKVLATYNSSVYCILIEYDDESRELKECDGRKMGEYINFIKMD